MTERFTQQVVIHDMKRRHLTVLRNERIGPRMQRITFGGADLEGFEAPGPADHVKLFFPDPATEEIALPVIVNGRPTSPKDGFVIMRDYTPVEFRETADGFELDLDFVLHGDAGSGGPAASWAATASAGAELVVGGPRGSRLAPEDADSVILVADETALPVTARWIDAFGHLPIHALLSVADAGLETYLASRAGENRVFEWFTGDDREAQVEVALRGLSIGEGTFVFLAGEALSLIPLRRYLRRELGLPKSQVSAHGYWKQGEANLDHHAPLDPSDPD